MVATHRRQGEVLSCSLSPEASKAQIGPVGRPNQRMSSAPELSFSFLSHVFSDLLFLNQTLFGL